MFKRELYVGAMGLLLALLVSGCTMGSPGVEVAQKAVDGFYQAQQQGDLDKALTFYTDKGAKEEWRGYLEHLRGALGTVQSFEQKGVEVNTVLIGRYYIFDYQVNYSSGKGAKETLTLFDSVDEGDTPLIAAYAIMAEGFKPLF